jgi:hypothetical protein
MSNFKEVQWLWLPFGEPRDIVLFGSSIVYGRHWVKLSGGKLMMVVCPEYFDLFECSFCRDGHYCKEEMMQAAFSITSKEVGYFTVPAHIYRDKIFPLGLRPAFLIRRTCDLKMSYDIQAPSVQSKVSFEEGKFVIRFPSCERSPFTIHAYEHPVEALRPHSPKETEERMERFRLDEPKRLEEKGAPESEYEGLAIGLCRELFLDPERAVVNAAKWDWGLVYKCLHRFGQPEAPVLSSVDKCANCRTSKDGGCRCGHWKPGDYEIKLPSYHEAKARVPAFCKEYE